MATIRLLSVGSRGDLQAYLAILLELQRRGHVIQLIGSINFEAIATARHAILCRCLAITGNCWHRSRGWRQC